MFSSRRLLLIVLAALVLSLPDRSFQVVQAQELTSWKTTVPASASPAVADNLTDSEKRIVQKVREFFSETDLKRQAEIAREIESDKAFDARRLSLYLHRARTFESHKPGSQTFTVSFENEKQQVAVRIPKGYTPEKPWPLILAYHHTGGAGEEMIELVKRSLGDDIEQYIVAAPTNYTPLNVESRRGWKPDHRLLLRELRKKFHLNSDRIYATGFSQGCYASWSYATFYGDELAGSAPVACTFDAAPEVPGLWELLMPNVATVPLLHVWGAEDRLPVYGIDLVTVTGTAAQLNNRVVDLTGRLNLNVLNYRIPNAGHTYEPPRAWLRKLLEKEREQYPATVKHRFRYLVQGRAYWLEVLSWEGDQWGLLGRDLKPQENETRPQTIGRMINELLAQLDGTVNGQTIKITRRHVGSFVLWFGATMIDWNAPITIRVNGKELFRGTVKPDLSLCLREAARTYDYDRLRWAGMRVTDSGEIHMLTSADHLPEIAFEKPKN